MAIELFRDTTWAYIPDGTKFALYDGGSTALGAAPGTITDSLTVGGADYDFYTFSAELSGNNVNLVTNRVGLNDWADTYNQKSVGDALESAATGGKMLSVMEQLEGLSHSEANKALDQMHPNVSYGAQQAALNNVRNVGKIVHSSLSDGRDSSKGVSTGDKFDGKGNAWAKVYARKDKQDTVDDIEGYTTFNTGVVLGYDETFEDNNNNIVLGVMGGWGYADVDYVANNNHNTQINTATCGVYAEESSGDFYINALFNFGFSFYDSSRTVQFASTNIRADSNYRGQQYAIAVEAGYDYFVGNFKITPKAAANWMLLHMGSYDEDKAGDLNLRLESQDYQILEFGAGINIGYDLQCNGYVLNPNISGMWYYDTIADKAETTSTFGGGGPAFSTEGADPARNRFDLGTVVRVEKDNGLEFNMGYNLGLKDEFRSHYGELAVTSRW